MHQSAALLQQREGAIECLFLKQVLLGLHVLFLKEQFINEYEVAFPTNWEAISICGQITHFPNQTNGNLFTIHWKSGVYQSFSLQRQ